MQQFKIRASAAGQIMGAKGLGKTGETYCEMWLKSQLYNREYNIKSKYLEKGNIVEYESIFFIQNQLNLGVLRKNIEHFKNDHFQGTPDIITNELVIDVKNSWDWTTFPLNCKTIPNKDYEYQLQIYMELTGKKNAKLVYILSDTPENLIDKEAFYKSKSLGFDEVDWDVYEKVKEQLTYEDVPNHLKFRVFDIQKDESIINKLKERVEECRVYINKLIES